MRSSLVMGFRTILRVGKVVTRHDWMNKVTESESGAVLTLGHLLSSNSV